MTLRAATAALALVLALAGVAGAQEKIAKRSGLIVGANERAGTLVLAEVGPWRVRDGVTVITYRTITFTPATEFAIVFRAEDAGSGFPNDWVETPLEPWAVYVDDYVTIECRGEGARLVAVKLTVTDIPGARF